MTDLNNPGNGTEPADYTVGSLDINDNQSVSSYASQSQQYPVENLEVRDPNAVKHSSQIIHPLGNSFKFSRRKAMVVSLVITMLVIILTAVAMLFLVKYSSKTENNSKLPQQQDLTLKDGQDSVIPNELQGAQQSLLVNGDVVTRGNFKVSNGTSVSVLRLQDGATGNQTITLPNASGTICLDSNNCGYSSLADMAGLQGQVSSLQTVVNALSQVQVPAAGVTSLNNQKGSVSIQGSLNQISVSTNNGVLTLSTPQDLDANANVQFGSLAISPTGQILANKLVQTGAGNSINIDAGNDFITFTAGGRIFQLPNSGGASQTICTTGASCASGGGTAVLLASGSVQNESDPSASIFINDTGGGNLLQLQTGGVDKLVVANNGNTTVSGSLTVSSLGNGFVKSTGGALSVVGNINLASSDVTGTLAVTNGGIGLNTIPANGVLVGNGASPVSSVVAGGAGLCLMSTAGAPSFQACPGGGGVTSVNGENGMLTVAGTANQVNVSTSTGTITLSTPQNIHVAATPTFAGLTLSGLGTGPVKASAGLLSTGNINLGSEVSGLLGVTLGGTGVSTTPSNGQLLIGNGTGYTLATLTAGSGVNITNGAGTITIAAPSAGSCASCANQALSNLSGVALNTSLLTGSTTIDLGSNAAPFRDLYLGGSATNNFRFTGVATGARTITVPNASGTLAISASGNIALDVAGNLTITGQIPIANGGTNSNTAAGARTNLGAAASGANTDITSLAPSSTLTVGSTGQTLTLQGNASTTLSANSGANVTTLGFAAPSGTNTITFPALTGTVCVSSGNCATAGAAGGDLTGTYPNPTIAKLQGTNLNISGPTGGQVLIYNGTNGRWENHGVSGDVTLSETGTATIANNAVTSAKIADGTVTGTDLASNTVANNNLVNSSLTVTAGTGLTGGGLVSLGSSSTALDVVYGSSAGTAVQGNVQITCTSGTGNLTGGGNTITLGSGGSCNNVSIVSNPTFTGPLTVGASGTQGSFVLYDGGSGVAANTGTLQVISTLGQNTTYTLPDPGASTVTICLSTGNCAGAGGGITGTGTNGKIAKFTSSGTVADSILSEASSTITLNGNMVIQGSNSLSLGTSSSLDGSVKFYNAAGTHYVALQAPASDPASDLTFKLPSSYGANGDCLQSNGSGGLSFTSCTGGAGGGVTSIDGQTGVVSVANATGSSGTITIDDASTAQKGIAQFNSTNFSAASGVINTIQNIDNTAAPTFAGLRLTGLGAGAVVSDGSGNLSSTQLDRNSSTYFSNTLTAANGGTGQSSYTTGDLLYASAATTLSKLAAVAAGQCLMSNGVGTAPSWSVCPGSGGVSSVNTFTGAVTIQGTTNQVVVANSTGTITLSTPQDINTTSAPQFSGLGLTGTLTFSGVATDITTGANQDLTLDANGMGKTILSDAVDVAGLLSANGGVQTNGANISTSNGALSLGSGNITTTGTVTSGLINGQTISSSANFTGTVTIQGSSSLTLGTSSSLDGSIAFQNAAGTHTVSLQAPTTDPTANFTLKLPSVPGANTNCLKTDGSGNLYFDSCAAAGSGVTSLDGLTGGLTIANSSGSGATITIDDATTVAKGIASFNTTNFSVVSGAVSIKTGGVGSTEIADGSVTGTDIASNTVANSNLVNSSLTVGAGTNLTGGGSVSLGGTVTLNVSNSPSFSGTLTVTGASSLNGGATIQGATINTATATDDEILFAVTPGGAARFDGTVTATDLTANRTYTLPNVTGTFITSGNLVDITAVGTVTSGTWNATAITDTYVADTLTINSSSTVDWTALNNYPTACSAGQAVTAVGDTLTCATFAASSGSGSYIQNQNASQQASANFWISGSGRADVSMLTPLLDTATAVALNVGTTNATQINLNQNVSVASGKTLTVVGGATSLTGATTGDAVTISNSTSTGNIAVFKDNSTTIATFADGGAVTLQNSTNSANGFVVNTSSGSTVLNVNTLNSRVGINVANPQAPLEVGTDVGGTFTDGFEDGTMSPFSTVTAAVWTVVNTGAHAGTFTAKAGNPGANGTSSMTITKTLTSAGNISFYEQVSSEGSSDFLRFYIDGVQQNAWSGTGAGWNLASFAVASGSHTFMWSYTKDPSVNFGADTGWIDDVQITNVAGSSISAIFDGNVGIGVTSPSNALEVNGTILATTVQAATFDTGSAVVLNVGTTNATQINLNKSVVVAANQSLTITGGATGSRPGSPTEGMIFYDTTTKQLLTYANGKWQADRTEAVLVAASNSSQADKDAADYVADGNTGTANDGDQVQINAALTAASGKKVILLAGTYVADATILIPNNTTLSGVGPGTVIELADLDVTDNLLENSDTTTGTGIEVSDFKIDGRSDLNTAGTQNGIYLNAMGAIGTYRQGAKVNNITTARFRDSAIALNASYNTIVMNSAVQSTSTYGINLTSSSNNTVTNNTVKTTGSHGIYLNTSANNTVSSNTIQSSAGNNGIYIVTGTNNAIVGNTVLNPGTGIGLITNSFYNTVTGNTVQGASISGISLFNTANNNTVSSNNIYDSGSSADNNGINVGGADNNNITGNFIADSSATNTNYAISISSSTSDNNYLADNYFRGTGTPTINDAGTGTVFGGQIKDASNGNYYIQPAGTVELMKNTNVTGTFAVSGATTLSGNLTVTNGGNVAFQKGADFSTTGTSNDVNFGTGALFRLTGSSTQTITGIAGGIDGRLITLVNAASQSATISNNSGSSVAANRIITGTGADITLVAGASINLIYDSGASFWRVVGSSSAVGGGTFVNLQGSTPGTADVGNFNITGTGIAATLQGTSSVKTPLIDAITAGTLSLGTVTANAINIAQSGVTTAILGALTVAQSTTFSGAVTFSGIATDITTGTNEDLTIDANGTGKLMLSDSVVVAAGKSLTITGDITANRPSSPTEGMMFYDTTTKRILAYSNGKWQADRSDTILVAASNSSQTDKDAADYVATGTSDQTTINTALTVASGKKVILLAGTYTTDDAISIPNNTTLSGVGSGTLIQFANINTLTKNMIANTDTSTGTGITIRDMRLDGNKATNTSGTQHGISLTNMGGGTGSSARQGALVAGVTVTSFRAENIYLSGSSNNRFTNVVSQDSAIDGMQLTSTSSNNVITGSKFQGNADNGLLANGSSASNTISGNNAQGNANAGFQLANSSNNTLSGNTSNGNTLYGFTLNVSATNNTVSANIAQGNTSGGFNVVGTSNTLTGNAVNGGTYGFNITGANNTVSGSTVQGNTQGIFVAGNHANINGNTVNSSTTQGIYLNGSDFSSVSSNKVYDSGSSTTNNGIYIQTSDSTSVTSNIISDGTGTTNCSSNCYAIFIFNSTSDNTYLADNQLGNGTINDVGTGTVYGGQTNSSGNFVIQPAGTIELMKNTNVTGNLAVTGTGSFTGGSVTVATATATDDRIKVVVATGGAARFDGTITNADLTAARTWTLPDEGGTICIVGSTSCLSGAGFVQFAPASVQADTSTNSSIFINKTGASGNLIQLQKSALDLFIVNSTGAIQLGSTGNGITLSGSGGVTTGSFTLNGTARNTKTITMNAEYAGAVLDALSDTSCSSANNGTMTSGFTTTGTSSKPEGYYNWTSSQGTAQCYDVVVQVPIPSDFDGFTGTQSVDVWSSNTTNGTIVMDKNVNGTTDGSAYGTTLTPGSASTWTNQTFTFSGSYTSSNANQMLTLRIRMSALSSAQVNLGRITLQYYSKF